MQILNLNNLNCLLYFNEPILRLNLRWKKYYLHISNYNRLFNFESSNYSFQFQMDITRVLLSSRNIFFCFLFYILYLNVCIDYFSKLNKQKMHRILEWGHHKIVTDNLRKYWCDTFCVSTTLFPCCYRVYVISGCETDVRQMCLEKIIK